ncbi:MAG: Hsp20/alpha crystallin family protein [Spirochaetia bacterium]|jgi:HSP20 family molecular chaperone IbpA|nr:Hsp20/alpha crystallin family protein [Spirochaetia bacterium]
MNNLTLYGNNPFDLIDRLFSNDELLDSGFRTPAVDISEEDNRYLIEAELPGLSEKDVKLEIKDGILYLSTAKKEAKEEKSVKNRWLRRERREFQFSRSFDLPDNIDLEKIEASFRDGLLSVTLPKKAEAAPRIVPVKAA